MYKFSTIPNNSQVLITVPVLLYAIVSRGEGSLPVSTQCMDLVTRCGEKSVHGYITTTIVAQFWNGLYKMGQREVDIYERGEMSLGVPPRRVEQLLNSELSIATPLASDFIQAALYVRDLSIPPLLALSVAAVIRQFSVDRPLFVPYQTKHSWPESYPVKSCWFSDGTPI